MSDEPADTPVPPELLRLRSSIDNIDAALIHLLAERFKATQTVGYLKARERMSPADPAREERQIARLRSLAQESGLDPVFAEKFLAFIVAEVIHHHEQIAEGEQATERRQIGDASPGQPPDVPETGRARL